MRPILPWCAAVCAIFAFAATTATDLEREFSIDPAKGPSNWTFGWKDELQGSFLQFPHRFPSEFWGASVIVHSRTGGPVTESSTCCPLILKHVGDRPVLGAPGFRLAAGSVMLHPGPKGEYSVARWACPAASHYTLEASFATVGYGSTDVHVGKNNHILASASLNGIRTRHDFYFSRLECHHGESLEFSVGYGDNRNFTGDSTSLSVRIAK
ncbi:MAG: hypothetical protein JST93_19185 [Acidobacteria bacterium]|nr:hypothetical protein [Acidobacteriota bacterium]